MYARACDEIDKLLRYSLGRLTTGPHHRFSEPDRRMRAGRGFINDANLPVVDRIHAVDDAHVRLPRADQIYEILVMLRIEKVEAVLIRRIELGQRSGCDRSQ